MQSSFEKAIEDAVRRAYISGRTGESLTRRMNDAVRQAVKEYGAKATLRAGKDYAKKVVSQLDAESLKVFSTDKDVATKAMKNSSKLVMDFAKRLDKVDEKASKNIIKAITSLNPGETDWRTAARAAMQKAGLAKHHAKTEIETFAGAMDRARVVDTALKGGIRRFLYDGPSGTQRPYCKDKVGKVYDIDELLGLDNGQGLPGIYYCGGYGCRHRLVPQYDDPRDPISAKHWNGDYDLSKVDIGDQENYNRTCMNLFGKQIPVQQILRLSGAPDESSFRIYSYYDSMSIHVDHEFYQKGYFYRTISKQGNGKIKIHNDYMFLDKDVAPSKAGLRTLSYQIKACRDFGIEYMDVVAGKSSEMTGYRVWPGFGYNMKLTDYDKNQIQDYVDKNRHVLTNDEISRMENASDILDLYSTDAGRFYWGVYGSQRAMYFNTNKRTKCSIANEKVMKLFGVII